MSALDPTETAEALDASYRAVSSLAGGLTDPEFDRPTRCQGLAVGPLLVRLLFDAQRALMAFATPARSTTST